MTLKKKKNNRVFVALDSTDLSLVQKLADQLNPHVAGIKLGLEFFCAHGVAGVKAIAAENIFLDLKLHDIPNTVGKSVTALTKLKQVRYVTLHTSGGIEMLKAAQQAAEHIQLLGVTMLTSLNQQDLRQMNIAATPLEQVRILAGIANAAGLYGIVSSGQEAAEVRKQYENLKIVTPGIRPAGSAANDQQRVLTPQQAIDNGADYLVIGRPITESDDPVATLKAINIALAK